MISINKQEAEFLRKRFKNITIARTVKRKSKRHKYYAETSKKVLKALSEFRDYKIT